LSVKVRPVSVLFLLSDYVLVYEEDIQSIEERKAGKTAKKEKGKLTEKERHELWREKFIENLLKAGVQTEEVGPKVL